MEKIKWFKRVLTIAIPVAMLTILPTSLVSCSKTESTKDTQININHEDLNQLYDSLQSLGSNSENNCVTDQEIFNLIEQDLGFGSVLKNINVQILNSNKDSGDLKINLTMFFKDGISFVDETLPGSPNDVNNDNILIIENVVFFKEIPTKLSQIIITTLNQQTIQSAINNIIYSEEIPSLNKNGFISALNYQCPYFIDSCVKDFKISTSSSSKNKSSSIKQNQQYDISVELNPGFVLQTQSTTNDNINTTINYSYLDFDNNDFISEISSLLKSKILDTNINQNKLTSNVSLSALNGLDLSITSTYSNNIFFSDGLVSPTYIYELDIKLNDENILVSSLDNVINKIKEQIYDDNTTVYSNLSKLVTYKFDSETKTLSFQIRTRVWNISSNSINNALNLSLQLEPKLLTTDLILYAFNFQNLNLIPPYKNQTFVTLNSNSIQINIPKTDFFLFPSFLSNANDSLNLNKELFQFDSTNNQITLKRFNSGEATAGLLVKPTISGLKNYALDLEEADSESNLFNANIIAQYLNIPPSLIKRVVGNNPGNKYEVNGKLAFYNVVVELTESAVYQYSTTPSSQVHQVVINNLVTNIPYSSSSNNS